MSEENETENQEETAAAAPEASQAPLSEGNVSVENLRCWKISKSRFRWWLAMRKSASVTCCG